MKISSKQIFQNIVIMAILCTFCLGITIILHSGVFTATVSAAIYGDFEYEIINGNEVEIKGYTGSNNIVTIPDKVNGMIVTSIGNYAFEMGSYTEIQLSGEITNIGEYAFAWCDKMTGIIIPDKVDKIGAGAFSNCRALESIIIPEGAEAIEAFTFQDCLKLTTVNLPSTVADIGDFAFSGCGVLETVNLPIGLKNIGEHAFQICRKLSDVILPDGLLSIGRRAFHGCSGITEIEIPASVTEIGDSPFSGCADLQAIVVNNGNKNYTSDNGVLFNTGKTVLIQYPAGKKAVVYTIPADITEIGGGAFYGADIDVITISKKVKIINLYWTFSFSSLQQIIVAEGNSNYASKSGVLFNKSMDAILVYPVEKNGTWYKIPSGVKTISPEAFTGVKLLSITVPGGVETIDDRAFISAENLSVLVFPDSVTAIGSQNFDYCDSLTSAVIPSSVQSIDDCHGLPKDLTVYGNYGTVAEQFASEQNLAFALIDTFNPPNPEPPYGDVNDDGDIDSKDVTELKRYLAGWPSSSFRRDYADVNGDGSVNDTDTIILKRFNTGGWDVTFGE